MSAGAPERVLRLRAAIGHVAVVLIVLGVGGQGFLAVAVWQPLVGLPAWLPWVAAVALPSLAGAYAAGLVRRTGFAGRLARTAKVAEYTIAATIGVALWLCVVRALVDPRP